MTFTRALAWMIAAILIRMIPRGHGKVSPDATAQFKGTDIAGAPEKVSPGPLSDNPQKDWSSIDAYV